MLTHLATAARTFALAGAAAAGLTAAAADRPQPAGPLADVLLARSALTALDGDPQLRDVNVVVSVVDRVAVVGGPVPSAEVGRRAEAVVRNVPGVVDVRNRCYEQSRPDPLLKAVADRMKGTAAPKRPPAGLPNVVTPPRGEPARPPDTAVVMGGPPNPVVARRISDRPGLLGDPVAAGGGRPAAAAAAVDPTVVVPGAPVPARPTAIERPAPSVGVPTVREVQAAVTAARAGDPRFAGLTVDLRDGTATVSGTARRDADAWALVDELRRVPGVRRVVLGTVTMR